MVTLYLLPVWIISRTILRDFWKQYPDAEQPLKAWFREAKLAEWQTPAQVKRQYRSTSVLGRERVVFNIVGNKYRLVVAIKYAYQVVYIRFVGTHRQYDGIDVHEV